MANQLDLTSAEITRFKEITSDGNANFDEGYRYIYGLIRDNPHVDAATKFFFKGAAEVNSNADTNANTFIRAVTAAGLAC